MIPEDFLIEVGEMIERDKRLVHLPPEGRSVFVGDTHGDLDAVVQVAYHYLKESYRIVFLGDYVDRGDRSLENILFLLRLKREHPERVFLLAGNHEGFMAREFSPANFWDSLSWREREAFGFLFSRFPLAATSPNGILALHGSLPDLGSLEEIDQIAWGDSNWDRIVWGDFVEMEMESSGAWWGRPQFGAPYFMRLMDRYQKRVLVRSHQPNAPLLMFKNRCVTIFTSSAYLPVRTILIADMDKEIRSAEDVQLVRI